MFICVYYINLKWDQINCWVLATVLQIIYASIDILRKQIVKYQLCHAASLYFRCRDVNHEIFGIFQIFEMFI